MPQFWQKKALHSYTFENFLAHFSKTVYNILLLGVVGVYRVDEKASNRHHSKMIAPLSKISEVEHCAPSKEQVQRTGGRRIPTEVHH